MSASVIITLTAQQAAAISAHLRPGCVLLGKVGREMFRGSNAASSGSLEIEFGNVPLHCLGELRRGIREALAGKQTSPPRKRKARAIHTRS